VLPSTSVITCGHTTVMCDADTMAMPRTVQVTPTAV
jgi:hypothetical protein